MLLVLPLLTHLFLLPSQVGYLLLDTRKFGVLFALTTDGFAFNLKLSKTTADFIEFLGHGVALHTKLCCGFVHQVNGFVWQEALGDVTLRELYGSNDGVVLDTHLVVVLVTFLQTTQDADAGKCVGLIDHDGLESAFQRLVLLEVFLVLVERSGTDASHLTAGQSRLQDVCSIHCAFALTCTNEGVYLVDEEDDAALTLGHFLDDALQSLLKLALVHSTGHERAHVEAVELFVLQVLGHISTQDSVGKSLDYSSLTSTWFTYQDRVIFCPSRENLQHTTYLVVSSDDGVELPCPSLVHEIASILLQALLFLLLIWILYHSIILLSPIFNKSCAKPSKHDKMTETTTKCRYKSPHFATSSLIFIYI